MQSKREIKYWDEGSVLLHDSIDSKYFDTIAQLLQHDFLGLNFEKISSTNIYSVRVSIKERLLTASWPNQCGQYQLVILAQLPTHDYPSSKQLAEFPTQLSDLNTKNFKRYCISKTEPIQ